MAGESIAMVVVFGFRVVRDFLLNYCGERSTLYKRLVALLPKICVTNGSWFKSTELKADPVTLGVRL